jgi:integrase
MLGGERRSVTGGSRQEARRALDDLRRRHRQGLLASRSAERESVAAHLRRWLAGQRPRLEAHSWRCHSIYIDLHIAPAIGAVPLAKLTAADLRALYADLVRPRGDLAPKTVREIHGTIRQALQQAVDDGVLPRNVALDVRPPRMPARGGYEVLSPEQMARFWGRASADRLYALWRLAAQVPTRSGELRGLRWDDLDERRGRLVIRRNLQKSEDAGRRLRVKGPKSAAGVRVIELDDELLGLLRQHRARQAGERLAAGRAWVDHGLVFCSRLGTPLLSGNLLRQFRRLLRLAGVPAHFRVHDLRHTAVSSLLAAGIPLAEVSQLAGHASPAITSALYAHAVPRTRAPATRQVADFYRQTDGPRAEGPGDGPGAPGGRR